MSATKKILTIDEHQAIAKEIKTINYSLNDQLRKASQFYGVGSKEVKMIERTKNALGTYRSAMDSNVIKENPTVEFKQLCFYYSGK